jgi:predicted Zn-dependent peptidase
MKRSDVVAQHAKHYRPDNASLIFVGDIDMKEARVLATACVRRLEAGRRHPCPPAHATTRARSPVHPS